MNGDDMAELNRLATIIEQHFSTAPSSSFVHFVVVSDGSGSWSRFPNGTLLEKIRAVLCLVVRTGFLYGSHFGLLMFSCVTTM
jgi:hypothetical protein